MGLFGKKEPAKSNEADLKEIEASVKLVRARMSERKMPLGELFAMMGEDERPILAAIPMRQAMEPERISPDQIARPVQEKGPTRVDNVGGQFTLGQR